MGSRPVWPELHSKTLFQKERKKYRKRGWAGGRERKQAGRQAGRRKTDRPDRQTDRQSELLQVRLNFCKVIKLQTLKFEARLVYAV